jgi:TonB-dependent receptor
MLSFGYQIARKFYLLGVLLCFVSQALMAAGSGTVKGKIIDKETKEVLPGASVLVKGTTVGAASDLSGLYVVHSIPSGSQVLVVSYVGYQSVNVDVNVVEGQEMTEDVFLEPTAITGKTVVVTAQAQGQLGAINQQLSANTIENVVSKARLQELPDASAAESIGRLPGISIDRYNGEATGVGIRGLAPKYNTVTVNGVTLPATNTQDRSVDLSLVSTNLLDAIDVKKANTPDMDADALGGTVDLHLKEAPQGFHADASAQGGYNSLRNYYGNYNTSLSLSNRFFGNDLGVIVSGNADRNNRDADKLNASYTTTASAFNADNIKVTDLTLRNEAAMKDRLGGSLLLDYDIPMGKVTGNGFFTQAKTDGTYRQDDMNFSHNSHYFELESNISTTALYTSDLGIKQDFGWLKYDASYSVTGSNQRDPNDYQWQFDQEYSASSGTPTATMALDSVYKLETTDTLGTGLQQIFIISSRLVETQRTGQLNVQVPFQITSDITGYVKAGGKFRWLSRGYDQEQWGDGNLQYGGGWNGGIKDVLYALAHDYPNDFDVTRDSTLLFQSKGGVWPLYRFESNYQPSNFLGGLYKLGQTPDLRLMQEMTNSWQSLRLIPKDSNDWMHYAINSIGYDYTGMEAYQAGYIMSEIHFGNSITLLPGVRFDADYSKYHGWSFHEAIANGAIQLPPKDMQYNTNVRTNSFWLPMVHLKIDPTDWLSIRLAGTETLTRPDYFMYAPITHIDNLQQYVFAANGGLKDSRSKNLDASVSIYQSYVGFLSVSPFYKNIDNLILYTTVPKMDTNVYKAMNAQLNIPPSWISSSNPQVDTYINNPYPATYKGIELDWQTRFWYLPSFLQGFIFDLNWTYIKSSIKMEQFKDSVINVSPDPHHHYTILKLYTVTETDRMPDQPAHLLNMTIGYDFKGFSIRLSYLYQSDKATFIATTPLTDAFTAAYARWDLAIQQRLSDNVQLYADLNNLNNEHDESLLGYREINPSSLQYYGRTMDVGLRLTL